MRRSRLLPVTILCATLLGVSLSVLNTVAQVSDFRPIRVNGTWTLDGAEGAWSAELSLDGRSLVGDVTVTGDEGFDIGQVEADVTSNGIAEGNLLMGGEAVASFSGTMRLGGVLEGSIDLENGDRGTWSGEWFGVGPTSENGWVAEIPRASPGGERPRKVTRAILGGRTSRRVFVDPNTLVSQPNDSSGLFQTEVEVAVDRSGNSDRVAAVSIDDFNYPNVSGPRPDLGYYISPDAGVTWPASLKGNPPGLSTFTDGADPVIDYDRNGDLFFCGLARNINLPGNEVIFVSRMPAGTNAFLNAAFARQVIPAQNRELDKPWCTAGLTSEATPRDIVYVVYVETELTPDPDESSIDFRFSLNAGINFSNSVPVADSADPTWPQIALSANGKVNVVWADNDNTPTPGMVDLKFDQCSVTFSPLNTSCGTDVLVARILKPDDTLPGTTFQMSWFPYIAVDNTPLGSGFIYVVWNEKSATGDTDIYFSRSDPTNINFSTRVAIVASQFDDFFPAISVDENHFIRVTYFGRLSSAAPNFDVYEIFSGDAGNTWSAETKVNDGPPIDPLGQPFIGDYIGIDSNFERHPGWMDSREGDFDVYSAVVAGC